MLETEIRNNSEKSRLDGREKLSGMSNCSVNLNSLLSPEINISDLELRNILDISAIQSLMDDFNKISGIAAAMIDFKGEILVSSGWQDICTQFHRIHPETKKNCIESDTYLTQNIKKGEFQVYRCNNNLWDAATPLYIGEKHVANIFFGQFCFDDEVPDRNLFEAQAEKYGFDKEKYLAALDKVPRLHRNKMNAIMNFYVNFASMISKLSFSNFKLAKLLSEQKESEEKLRKEQKKAEQYLDITPSIIINLDKNGNINLLNKHGASILECNQKDAIGKNWFETFLPTEIRDSVKGVFDSLINGDAEICKHYENEVITAKGTRKIIRWNNIIVKNDFGEIEGVLTSGEDITRQKKNEKKLLFEEEKYRQLVENINDLVYSVDTSGILTYLSPAVKSILGYTEEEGVGKHFSLFVHPDDLNRMQIIFKNALKGHIEPAEFRIIDKKGNPHTVHLTAQPIFIEDKITGFSGIISDITERIAIEQERLELEKQRLHSQKLESLGVLTGGIAHDFNNLLMAILGNLDIASQNPLVPPSANLSIQQALNAARRATELTQQMLAYAGKATIVNREIDLSRLVEENARLLRVSIHKTITVNLNTAKNLPYISGDGGQLQQVVMNLITNASDAIGAKAGEISITTGVMYCDKNYLKNSCINEKPDEGTFVFLEVEDTGCGMDEETLQRLFDPFFTTKFTGRGLGMSAVLGIVRNHKGAIIVKSKVNKGTTIRLLFPALEEKTVNTEENNLSGQITDDTISQISGTVLVADDEDAVRDVCKSMVELLGCRVLTASNGQEAVEVFQKNNPEIDCVILDLSMPVMDGIAALNDIKKINPEIKVILSSGFPRNDAMERFRGHGITGFIQKPYNLHDLEKALTSIMASV